MTENDSDLIALIENTSDGICAINTNYQITIVNSVFKKYFKKAYGVEVSKGLSVLDYLKPAEQRMWKRFYDRALKGEHFRRATLFVV